MSLAQAVLVIVVDTSYLLEFFTVPGHSTEERAATIRRRFEDAIKANHRIYVPLPCMFELANHISSIPQGDSRRHKAKALQESLELSLKIGKPWVLTPIGDVEKLRPLFDEFANVYCAERLSLTDASVAHQALSFRQDRYRGPQWRVHIWTLDHQLKAREPDNEEDAYLG